MKQILSITAVVACLSGVLGAANFSISGSDQGIDGFSLSIGNYYGVPQQEIMVIERSVPRDEMSVVYYLSRQSHHDARFITNMRSRGMSWWDITHRLGLDPRSVYMVERHSHRLRDAEIVDRVNVRFLSEYHHISPDEVRGRRRGGEDYNRINEHYQGKQDRHQYREERRDDQHGNRGSHEGKENRGDR
ncbi:MAG: hypothetical protein NTY39_01200 [Campylobacterales bacterium]|nr:hypothetical protein [Campylobacterales bacterium]